MKFIETHAHLYSEEFSADRQEIIDKAVNNGIEKIIMPNVDHTSIDGMLELEVKYPNYCIPMMGLHPCYVKKGFEQELYIVESWLQKRPFIAIGEIGLDYYWDLSFKDLQIEAFKIQAQWAKQYNVPIAIHSRESTQALIDVLLQIDPTGLKGVFHCFSGNESEAKQIVEMGFKLGIGGVITFKKNTLQEVIKTMPIEHLVLETDCPYLAPTPHRGKRNEPSYIPLIAQQIADIKQISIQEVAITSTSTAATLFSII